MKLLIYPLIFLISLSIFSQEVEEEFTPIVIGDKEAFLSSKTGEYVYRSHANTNPLGLSTTESGVMYKETKIHKVKAGESLYVIAKKLGLSVSELKLQNNLKDNNLKIGQKLNVVKHHKLKSSSPVISQAEGRIVARLAPGQTPNGMTPPDLPPDAMPGSTINLVVEKDAKESPMKQEVETEVKNVVNEAKEEISEDGTLIHTVKSGETLFSIARKYKVSMVDLKGANNLALNTISTGQKLKVKVYNPAVLNQVPQPIKVEDAKPTPRQTETTEVTDKLEEVVEEETVVEVEEGKEEEIVEVEEVVEEIEVPVTEKKIEVKQVDANEERTKALIEKYKKKEVTEPETDKSSIYVVKKGDTLWGIAKRYQIFLKDLRALNKLTTNVLSVGQKLKVK